MCFYFSVQRYNYASEKANKIYFNFLFPRESVPGWLQCVEKELEEKSFFLFCGEWMPFSNGICV